MLAVLQAAQWTAVLVHATRHRNESSALVWLSVLVLLPIALMCVYELGRSLGGHWLGAWSGLLWIAVPFLVIRLFDPRYRFRYTDEILPRALGLTESGELPCAVALLVAAVALVRAVRRGGTPTAFVAGAAAAVAVIVDPVSLLFLIGAAAAILLALRPRLLVPFAVGFVPAFAVLAAGGFDVDLDPGPWSQLEHNADFVREFFYSVRVVEWLPLAGAVAVARKSVPVAALLLGWFLSYLYFRGTVTDVNDGTFYRALLPALPAYVLLAASLPLLFPAPRTFRQTVLARR